MAKRILITDDASIMRLMLSNMLQEAGYEIAGEATNGLEAVAKYKELKPDLVTMDITMPEIYRDQSRQGHHGHRPPGQDCNVFRHGPEVRSLRSN